MKDAKIILVDREINLLTGVTTIGRTEENNVSLPDDVNISRFHAEIERRGDEFYLVDLKSSNGTLVNGRKLSGEIRLNNGDSVILGGTSHLQFSTDSTSAFSDGVNANSAAASDADGAAATDGTQPENAADSEAAAASPPSRRTSIVAGVVCGVAVIALASAGSFYYFKGSKCTATAVIVKPEANDTINKETEIEIELKDGECVDTAIFTLDGGEIARTNKQPFTGTIEPDDFAEFADGYDHKLAVILVDENGEVIPQQNQVEIAFDSPVVPTPTPEIVQQTKPGGKTSTGTALSQRELQDMSAALVKQFSGGGGNYTFNQQFLQEVQKKTGEYAQDGFSARAAGFRDKININFGQRNTDASLGYILAMSRSKFVPTKQGDDEGLWRMQNTFVSDLQYNGECKNKSLSDPTQECAAIAAAAYLAAIAPYMQNDPVYIAAVFGKSPQDAAAFQATLPAKHEDIWMSIKTAPEREQVVRFFAAGIVALNPQKFGLSKDRPLADLYRITQ